MYDAATIGSPTKNTTIGTGNAETTLAIAVLNLAVAGETVHTIGDPEIEATAVAETHDIIGLSAKIADILNSFSITDGPY